jgi:hypothetical protein
MATNWLVRRTVDLARPHTSNDVINCGYIYRDDNAAHVWEVTILRDGEPADLTGYTVRGYFIRSDETTVSITGSKTGNVATVQLNASCYALKGLLKGVVRLEKTGEVITVSAMHVRVDVATTDEIAIDQETRISIEDMLADVEAMLADTANYYTKSQTDSLINGLSDEIGQQDYIKNGTTNPVTLGGNVAITGAGALLKVESATVVSGLNVGASGYQTGSTNLPVQTGWTPLGIVGFTFTNSSWASPSRLALNQSSIEYGIRNLYTNAITVTLTAQVLYIRTSL